MKKNKRVFGKNFARFYENEIILGTSDTWSTSRLSYWPSKPAYYIVDWPISDAQTLTLALFSTTLLLSLQIYTVELQWKLDTWKNSTVHTADLGYKIISLQPQASFDIHINLASLSLIFIPFHLSNIYIKPWRHNFIVTLEGFLLHKSTDYGHPMKA